MKKIILILFPFLLTACGNMYDNIRNYLDEGETTYLPRPDSMEITSGKERIQFRWKPGADERVDACKIFWNNNMDSIFYPVNRSEIDKNGFLSAAFSFPESTYSFKIYQAGKQYRSIGIDATGSSYGDFYQSTLSLRKINTIRVEGKNKTVMTWSYSMENEVETELTYPATDGTVKTIVVKPGEDQTTLTDYLGESGHLPVTIKTSFLPEPEALDTFSVTGSDVLDVFYFYWLGKTDWLAEASDSFVSGEYLGPKGCIDENTSTFWHSALEETYPHWIIIDMKTNKLVKQVDAYQHPIYVYVKSMQVQLSADKENWTDVGEMIHTNNPRTSLILGEHMEARYIRIELTEGYNNYVNMCEIYVYGSD